VDYLIPVRALKAPTALADNLPFDAYVHIKEAASLKAASLIFCMLSSVCYLW
jgi:hypothetical protein